MRITREQFEKAKKGSLEKWDEALKTRYWRKWSRDEGSRLCAMCKLCADVGINLNLWCSDGCPLQDNGNGEFYDSYCCKQYSRTMLWERNHGKNAHENFLKDLDIFRNDIANLTYEMIDENYRAE